MKPKIVFLDEYSLAGRDLSAVKALGDYTGYDMTAPDEVAARCADAEIVVTNKVRLDAATIAQLPHLRLICVAATGVNNIDLDAAAEHGVEVRNAAGYSTHSVAETTLGAAIALLRESVYYDEFQERPLRPLAAPVLFRPSDPAAARAPLGCHRAGCDRP